MLESLEALDTRLFLWINGHHCTALDWTLWTLSQHWCWALVLALALFLLPLRLEPRRWWIAVAGVALCFLLADQGSVLLFKNTVCRLRPCHALDSVRMFRTSCGGQYGFVSSHAANAFAIVSFLWLRYRHHRSRLTSYSLAALLLWGLSTCYSRAYLGKHYPGDLLCGAIFGITIGLVVWLLATAVEKKFLKPETK